MPLSPHRIEKYRFKLLLLGFTAVLLSVLLALALGAVKLSASQVFAGALGWSQGEVDSQAKLIVQSLRLPRALMAASVGAILAVCGAISQGLFRNPLADPSLIGVSAGAAAGAAVVIVLLGGGAAVGFNISWISLGAFAGAMAVVLAVYRLSRSVYGTSVTTLLLAGVAFSYLSGSFTSLLEFFSSNDQLRQFSLWRMGGLGTAQYGHVVLASGVLIVILGVAITKASELNALLLGESEARYLGVDVEKLKRTLFVVIAGGVAISVALVGTIAFVGLLVPHAVRLWLGPDHRHLIAASAFVGAILLILADTLGRIVIAPAELPVGLMTSALGAPLFLYLLARRRAIIE